MATVPIFVDTEILLASVDDRDAERQARAREWISFCWQTRSGRISSQVLNELYNQAIQRFDGPHVLQQVRAQVRRWREAIAARPAPIAGNALLAQAEVLQPLAAALGLATDAQAVPDGLALAELARAAWAAGAMLDPAVALPLYVRDKVAQTTAEREAAARAARGEAA